MHSRPKVRAKNVKPLEDINLLCSWIEFNSQVCSLVHVSFTRTPIIHNDGSSLLSSISTIFSLTFPLVLFYLLSILIQRRQWHPTPVLLPGKSHGQRSLAGCSPWGHWESDTTERLHFHFSLSCIGEGNGNPLQYSCLENPRDRGA